MSNTYGYPPVERQFCGNCRYSMFARSPAPPTTEEVAAAILRAAADQCVDGAAHWELYAIAAELEGSHE